MSRSPLVGKQLLQMNSKSPEQEIRSHESMKGLRAPTCGLVMNFSCGVAIKRSPQNYHLRAGSPICCHHAKVVSCQWVGFSLWRGTWDGRVSPKSEGKQEGAKRVGTLGCSSVCLSVVLCSCLSSCPSVSACLTIFLSVKNFMRIRVTLFKLFIHDPLQLFSFPY